MVNRKSTTWWTGSPLRSEKEIIQGVEGEVGRGGMRKYSCICESVTAPMWFCVHICIDATM